MSHDSDDLLEGVVDVFIWVIGPPASGIGCIVYAVIFALALGLAYEYSDGKDDACEAIAGVAYERIDGVCYQKVDGNLIKVPK